MIRCMNGIKHQPRWLPPESDSTSKSLDYYSYSLQMAPSRHSQPPITADELKTAESLQKELVQIGDNADAYGMHHGPLDVWAENKELVQISLESGLTAKDLELSKFGVDAMTQVAMDHHLASPALALAFSIEGLNALRLNQLPEAFECAARGSRYLGPEFLKDNPKAPLIERARKGGKAKNASQQQLKNLVAQLLEVKMPPGGWISRKVAIDAVCEMLMRTTEYTTVVESCGFTTHNIVENVKRWVNANPDTFPISLQERTP